MSNYRSSSDIAKKLSSEKSNSSAMGSTLPMELRKEKKVAVIGAGISGLLACKHLIEKGFTPVVFEAQNGIGGVWSSNTIHSTKLQNPKDYFQFSDFPWPHSVSETFPHHEQVMDYVRSYALHFNLFPLINFNSRVVSIDYCLPRDVDMKSWDLWGGNGEAFSPRGKWNVTVEDVLNPMKPHQVHQVDFVILCIGKFSDLPNIPHYYSMNTFNGEVLHSMDYAAMGKTRAAELTLNKRVAVVGFQKSAMDIAAEISERNGIKIPCTLVFRTAHWAGPENLVRFTFKNLNRFSEFMVHKPGEGLILFFLAFLLSPLKWIISKFVECYLRWIYPLKKYGMVPNHSVLKQIYWGKFRVLPENFYDRVKEGSLVLRRSPVLDFCQTGLILEDQTAPLETDVVIFATGYKSDEKIANIFSSMDFKKYIIGSSTPFYRECIHPGIPQLAIMGYSESLVTVFTFEMRSKWIAHFLAGKFRLPEIRTMEDDAKKWEDNARGYSCENYKRACVGSMLQIHCNDEICKDIGCIPTRKRWFLPELFSCYHPADYANI